MISSSFEFRRLSHIGIVTASLAALAAVSLTACAEPPADESDESGETASDTGALGSGPLDPAGFGAGEVNVVTTVKTGEGRKPISRLIYGINGSPASNFPPDLLKGVTFVRRGGDRGNSYNWETNISNGSYINGFQNDDYLLRGVPADKVNSPAAVDLELLRQHRAAGRAVMVPFVLNDWVSGPRGAIGDWKQAGWKRDSYFRRVSFVSNQASFPVTPNLNDNVVSTDEHFAYIKNQFPRDITDVANGTGQLLVGIDNEPDLYHYNFPMLQSGQGADIVVDGQVVSKRVKADEFTSRVVAFASRVKQIAPNATVIGPSHYNFDGWVNWHGEDVARYSPKFDARWYMDDFLATMNSESKKANKRLLDMWDFHWYPQGKSNGTFVSALDNNVRPLTPGEVDQVVQGSRSYWDPTYDEKSWITEPWNLGAPAAMIPRLQARIAKAYPGTKIGVGEYNPGGMHHIASGLGVADSIGVFQRLGVDLAAFWPLGDATASDYAFGALKLIRNADGNGLAYAETDVKVEHPEVAESSVYAGSGPEYRRVTVLVINKTQAPRSFGLRLSNAQRLANVDIYRIDAGHANPFYAGKSALTKLNAYAYNAPALSATMLVFRAR